MDDQLTDEQLIDIIAEIDTDQSGTVDFDGKATGMVLSSVYAELMFATYFHRVHGDDDRRLNHDGRRWNGMNISIYIFCKSLE